MNEDRTSNKRKGKFKFREHTKQEKREQRKRWRKRQRAKKVEENRLQTSDDNVNVAQEAGAVSVQPPPELLQNQHREECRWFSCLVLLLQRK